MTIHDCISHLLAGKSLSREDAAALMRDVMQGDASPAQLSAILASLRTRGETIDEITGFAETMRTFATRVETARRPLVDTCGTGGDGAGTFNISTTAAFVVAGAGVAVAKHGNRAASSRCGSADVLAELGINIDASPQVVGRCIDSVGIGFLFARTLHQAMRHVAPVRAELRARTVFNVLGPLTNPAGADCQVVGVFDRALVEPLASVLLALGTRHAFVLASEDGLDEASVGARVHVAEAVAGNVRTYALQPEDVGVAHAPLETVVGGDAAANAAILRDVLDGKTGPTRDIAVYNAAFALVAADKADNVASGVRVACDAIDSGAARAKLDALVEASHDS